MIMGEPIPRTMSGAVLAEIRAEMGRQRVSGAALARALGQSQTHVAAILRGDTTLSVDQLEAIIDALGVDWTEVLIRADGRLRNLPPMKPEDERMLADGLRKERQRLRDERET